MTETTPLVITFNYCLLLIKLGKLKDSSRYWLQETQTDTPLDITNAKLLLNTLTNTEDSYNILTKFSLKVLLEQ